MADEAFALSPISARAAQPSEEDYDAISEAFMETSRGRWFLGEYARRNRNADTRMVLDAVARIEHSLAAQKQPEPAPEPAPVLDNPLPEAIATIKAALTEARAFASASIDGLALEQHLAPVRKGARVIREISWRWREIGADSRICDLIDSQVAAIEASCGQLGNLDPHSGLSAAFDLIGRQIAAFDDSEDAAEATAEAAAAPSPAPVTEIPAAPEAEGEAVVGEAAVSTAAQTAQTGLATVETVAEVEAPQAEFTKPESQAPAAMTSAEATAITTADMTAEVDLAAGTVEEISVEAIEAQEDARDEAVLDLISAEMSATDVSDAHLADIDEPEMAEAPASLDQPIAPAEEVAISTMIAPAPEPPAPALQPAPAPPPQPEPEPSIGSELVAGGLLRKAPNDPLAALRRLSQAEKIALFS